MMDRRAFLGTLTGRLLVTPFAVEAQHAGRSPRVGFLILGQPSARITINAKEAFSGGLREEGYLEGQGITIEYRYSDFEGLLNAANDLVRLNVDVIIAEGTAGALAAKRATSTIPIVAWAMADPIADELVASLARPGANVTGNTFLAPELGPKRLQLLQEIVPGVTRIAVLQHPHVYGEGTMRNMLTEMEGIAKTGGIELQANAPGPPRGTPGRAAPAARSLPAGGGGRRATRESVRV